MGRLPRDRVSRRRATSTSRAATCGRSIATSPSCTTLLLQQAARRLRGRRRDRDRDAARASTSTRCSCGSIRPPRGSRSSRRRRRPRSSPSICWRWTGRTSRCDAAAGAAREARSAARAGRAAAPPHAGHARSGARAAEWLDRFEGAGLDGVIAKPADGRSTSRASARCSRSSTRARPTAWSPASAGTRAGRDAVGSLLLGLYDDDGRPAARRRDLVVHDGQAASSSRPELAPLRENALERSSLARLGQRGRASPARMPGGQSRWSAGKDLSWEPLRSSGCARSSTTTCRATGSATRPCSSAGGPTSAPTTAATTSSRSRPLTSSRRSSAPGATGA